MKVLFATIISLFLLSSCAFFRLGSNHTPDKKVSYKIRKYEYEETVNGKKGEKKSYFDYRKKITLDYLEGDVFDQNGIEVDAKVSVDELETDTRTHKLKLRNKDGWQDLTLTEAWFRVSMYSATIIPFWGTSRYVANVEVSKEGKQLCKKSCDGGYFYMQFLPLIVVTPFSFYYNEKKFQKNLVGYCLERCLTDLK